MIKKMHFNPDSTDKHICLCSEKSVTNFKQVIVTDEDLFKNVRKVIKDCAYSKTIRSVKAEVGHWVGIRIYDALSEDIQNFDKGVK